MDDYEDDDRRPIALTSVERAFQKFQMDTAISIAAKKKLKASKRRRGATESDIVKARTSCRNALRRLLTTGQILHTEAGAAIDNNPFFQFYQTQAEKAMRESCEMLDILDTTGGSRRKRNKSRNKIYSVRKKSKRRRVKSTRRRHKKSTIHHRSKY